jgi:predicted transcriptional regulator
MRHHRSRAEIIATILQATGEGLTKTRILYAASLSFSQMQGYLEFLVERGLLRLEDDRRVYVMTEKGLRFLHAFDSLGKLTDDGAQSGEGGTGEFAGNHIGI